MCEVKPSVKMPQDKEPVSQEEVDRVMRVFDEIQKGYDRQNKAAMRKIEKKRAEGFYDV